MAKSEAEIHRECVDRFIALANTMREEGVAGNLVSAGLMTSSGIYATFLAAGGNSGGLTESGIGKVTEAYQKELTRIQEMKKQRDAEKGGAGGVS